MNKPIALDLNVWIGTLEVHKHLSGGVLVKLGQAETVLSPDDAVRFATAILGAAGMDVQFNPGKRLVTPP